MANFFLITLLPAAPRDPEDFHLDLHGLTIDIYDLTVENDFIGVPLGSADAVTESPYWQDIPIIPATGTHPPKLARPIIQHFAKVERAPEPSLPLLLLTFVAKSVATVAIPLDPAGSDPEYRSPDLRITLSRDGKLIGAATIEYNVPLQPVPLPLDSNPQTYIDYVTTIHKCPAPMCLCLRSRV
jgi:hypothetical protein